MIRHCVFLKYKAEISGTEKQALYSELKALGAILPGIVKFDAKANSSPEIGMTKGFLTDLLLISIHQNLAIFISMPLNIKPWVQSLVLPAKTVRMGS